MATIAEQKQLLRKQILEKRRTFGGPAKEKADKHIFQNVTHHQLYMHATCVCIFISMKDEPNTKRIIEDLFTHQKTVIVPKIVGGTISLYRIHSFDDVTVGTLGILEPKTTCEQMTIADCDVIFVPGVVFGRNGTRIGMGRGYYDRLLRGVSIPKIGIAYAFQLFDSLPTTDEDQRVDIIISDV